MSASRSKLAQLSLAALLALPGCGAPAVTIHGGVAHPVTQDGWPLTVEHFAPAKGAPVHPRPVILCHGVLANRRFFELEGEGSLPVVLSRAGFDVWLVDLRGRPDAGSPGWWFGEHTYDYDLDDFVRSDVDALLTYVLAQTHAPDVAWVGHSLGGMIAYARLGAFHETRIGALVTVGSPGFFAPASKNIVAMGRLAPALSLVPVLPMKALAGVEGHLGMALAPRMLRDTIFAKENLPRELYERLEEIGVNDAAKPELRQFLRSVRRGEFVSADGSVSYTGALRAIQTPSLVIVGRADELADPLVGRGVFERLGSADKELVIAGRAEGFASDYGHVDLLIGPGARADIFPRITRWLERHDGK